MTGRRQTVVITGSSAGVGRATARAFAENGAAVGLLARGREALDAAREEVERAGGRGLAVSTDVSDPDAVESAAVAVEEELGPIDVWVNCAMTTVYAPVAETRPDEFRRVVEVALLGYVYRQLAERGIRLLDWGTSGGVSGARHGACFMVGGEREAYDVARPLLEDLAAPDGTLYVGPSGAGHFVKLVLAALFHNWSHGSVIRSWLVELTEEGLRRLGDLSGIAPYVEDTGEQVWGVEYAMEKQVPILLLAQAVWGFYESRDAEREWAKSVALLRHGYGGHPLKEASHT